MTRTWAPLVLNFLIAACFSVAPAVAAGPDLSPAGYKALPVGAVLDYGNWKCNVGLDSNFEQVCNGDSGEEIIFIAKLAPVGNVAKSGYGFGYSFLSCILGDDSTSPTAVPENIDKISLDAAGRKSLASLWPLTTGKRASYHLNFEPVARFTNSQIEVTGTKSVVIRGKQRDVYVLHGKTRSIHCSTDYELGFDETWWYDPTMGVVVKYELKWIGATIPDQDVAYELKSLVLPPVPAVAQARKGRNSVPDNTPPAINVAETLQTDRATVGVAGRVTDASRIVEILVDGRPVLFKADGSFEVRRGVDVGNTVLKISALDEWGNRATREVTITRRMSIGSRNIVDKREATAIPDLYFGKYHALVIGNNRHAELPPLHTALNDARQVAQVLTYEYGFETEILLNATRRDILKALASYRRSLGSDDNLLIFYAGHGTVDEVVTEGYWLPVDAASDEPSNWISNNDITNMLEGIRAKHIMVVADSCFSGTLVRSTPRFQAPRQGRSKWLKRMLDTRSRTALVSGGVEPVRDGGGDGYSVFARAFLQALMKNKGVLDGQSLFDAVKRPVVLNADQTPRYSDIRGAGHDGGDFILVRKPR